MQFLSDLMQYYDPFICRTYPGCIPYFKLFHGTIYCNSNKVRAENC